MWDGYLEGYWSMRLFILDGDWGQGREGGVVDRMILPGGQYRWQS